MISIDDLLYIYCPAFIALRPLEFLFPALPFESENEVFSFFLPNSKLEIKINQQHVYNSIVMKIKGKQQFILE